VAHDWGHLGRELLGGIIGQAVGAPVAMAPPTFFGPAAPAAAGASVLDVLVGDTNGVAVANGCAPTTCDGMAWGGSPPPKGYKVVNYCGVATLRKIRRRRRRRMLSVSDKNDIASIVSMVGKGQMASALINRTSP